MPGDRALLRIRSSDVGRESQIVPLIRCGDITYYLFGSLNPMFYILIFHIMSILFPRWGKKQGLVADGENDFSGDALSGADDCSLGLVGRTTINVGNAIKAADRLI